jgi:hypothetical protein
MCSHREAFMTAGPGEEGTGHGRMRASQAERDQAIDALKAAFVHGRLTKDELEERAGQAFTARTHADLAALTADLPGEKAGPPAEAPPAAAPQPRQPVPALTRVHPSIKTGAGVLGTVAVAITATAVSLGVPAGTALALLFAVVIFTAIVSAVVAVPIAVALKLEARSRGRSGGQLPPERGPGEGGRAPRPEARWYQAEPLPPAAESDRPEPPAAESARRKAARRPGAASPKSARGYPIACASR